jgi:hypothetical protein
MKITLIVVIFFFMAVGIAVACIPQVSPDTIAFVPSDTPTSVIVTPSDDIISIEPTITASASAQIENTGGAGDGLSDGLSSCPSCTKTPTIPNEPPATGKGL